MPKGNHIELFAGVGMTGLAAERAGWQTVMTAEIDDWCRKVLRARIPEALHLPDVRDLVPSAGAIHRLGADPATRRRSGRRPLLISGGFPCQDVASASSTAAGLDGERSGLWGEFARVIRGFRPDAVLIENSPLLRRRGLDRILADLVEMGYDARWDCIPASAFGAPHRRDRIYIAAAPYHPEFSEPDDAHESIAAFDGVGLLLPTPSEHEHPYLSVLPRAGSMTNGYVFEETPRFTVKTSSKVPTLPMRPTPTRADGGGGPGRHKRSGGPNLRTWIADAEGNGRLNPVWVEWMMGLPLGWTDTSIPSDELVPFPGWNAEPAGVPRTVAHRQPDRAKRIKALGNGLVPHTAQQALLMIPDPTGAIPL